MAIQTLEQQPKSLLPPSLLFCPKVLSDGSLRLRYDPQYLHEHLLAERGLPQDEISQVTQKARDSGKYYPEFLQRWFHKETTHIQNVLQTARESLTDIDDFASRKDNIRKPWTRKLILDLFPGFKSIIDNGREKELFQDLSIEDYIDTKAIPLAKGFVEWCTNFMPDDIRSELLPRHEISNAQYLMDFIRQYRGGSIVSPSLTRKPNGDLYNPELNYDVVNWINLIYLAVVSQMIKPVYESDILHEFNKTVTGLFPDTGEIILGVCIDRDRVIQKFGMQHATSLGGQVDKEGKFKQAYSHTQLYHTRKTNVGHVIFLEREKEDYARMLKLIRGRFPLSDAIGGRFVVEDSDQVNEYIDNIRRLMPEWNITEESGVTVSPQSRWKEGKKFKVRWNKYPEYEFELAVYWFKEHSSGFGNWAQNLFGYEENFYRYRIQQLLDAVLPVLFPKSISGIDWNSEEIINKLYQHAYDKTLASALLEIPE